MVLICYLIKIIEFKCKIIILRPYFFLYSLQIALKIESN